jgi:hypothetical protein
LNHPNIVQIYDASNKVGCFILSWNTHQADHWKFIAHRWILAAISLPNMAQIADAPIQPTKSET